MIAPSMWFEIPGAGPNTPIPNTLLLNVKMGRRLPIITKDGNRPFTFNFFAKNLLDETPCETVVGVSCERTGREFFLSVEYDAH
jgi:hypothetical protein